MKYNTIFTLTALLAGMAAVSGCATDTTVSTNKVNATVVENTTNTNSTGTTNKQTNSNTVVVTNTSNANANEGEVDTSDWETYHSDELALSFSYPQLNGNVEYFSSNFDTAGSLVGWRHNNSTIIAGSASSDLALEREYKPTDFAYFEKRQDKFFLNGTHEIKVDKVDKINGQDFIIYRVSSLSPAIDQNLPAKASMINFPSNHQSTYRSITFYFSNPSSDEEIMQTLSSVKFE